MYAYIYIDIHVLSMCLPPHLRKRQTEELWSIDIRTVEMLPAEGYRGFCRRRCFSGRPLADAESCFW